MTTEIALRTGWRRFVTWSNVSALGTGMVLGHIAVAASLTAGIVLALVLLAAWLRIPDQDSVPRARTRTRP